MSKRPPELTWQDKAILVVIPVVVLIIFIVANYLGQDLNVADAISQKLPKTEVRDAGLITELLPSEQIASQSVQRCKLRTREGTQEFLFRYNVQGSDTMNLQVGRLVQFYGEFKFDPVHNGILTVPYKGKSGRMSGWAVYENRRYYSHDEDKDGGL